MSMYACYGLSLQNQRTVNMDSLLIKQRKICGQQVCLAVVCDGVGSMADGAVAASDAVHCLSTWMDQLTALTRVGLALRDVVQQTNESIVQKARIQGLKTASTLSALLLVEGRYYIVHLGDSRIYSYAAGAMTQLTYDQVQDGKLTSCIGWMLRPEIYYNEGICTGNGFLLCSDGLIKRTDPAQLQMELTQVKKKTLKKTAERMAQYAVQCGEMDNISLVLILCENGR